MKRLLFLILFVLILSASAHADVVLYDPAVDTMTVYKGRNCPYKLKLSYEGDILTESEIEAFTEVRVLFNSEYMDSTTCDLCFEFGTVETTIADEGMIIVDLGSVAWTAGTDSAAELIAYDATYTNGRIIGTFQMTVSDDALAGASLVDPLTGAFIFKTMDCSSGTDPVADSVTDTLVITGTTPVTVTGNSTTDTVTISVTEVDPTVDTSGEIQTIIGAGVYEPSFATGAVTTYFRGDKTWQTLPDTSATNEIEVVDEDYTSGNYDADTTHAESQNRTYDYRHLSDTNDNGFPDTINDNVTVGTTAAGKNVTVNATLGAELAPALTGASGVNWTFAGTYTSPLAGTIEKAGAGTDTITPTAATTIVAGTTYLVTITTSAFTAGSFAWTLGGVAGIILTDAVTESITQYITAATTGKLIITPTDGSRFVINSISIKALTDATGDVTITGNLKAQSPITSPVSIVNADSTAATDLLINPAVKASGNLIDAQIAGTSKFSVSGTGRVASAYGFGVGTYSLNFAGQIAGQSGNWSSILLPGTVNSPIDIGNFNIETSGTNLTLKVSPTYNQASGTASNTDLLINRTETAVGSGAQLLIDAKVGGASKFKVTNTGKIGCGGTVTPTAYIHTEAGTATSSTAPLKFTPGVLNTIAEQGAFEFGTTTHELFFTPTATRQRVALEGTMTFEFTTEANLTDPLIARTVLLDGDNDSDSDTIDLQNGTIAGQELILIASADIDADDTFIINYADTTATNAPALTFDKVGESATLFWTGTMWVVTAYQTSL